MKRHLAAAMAASVLVVTTMIASPHAASAAADGFLWPLTGHVDSDDVAWHQKWEHASAVDIQRGGTARPALEGKVVEVWTQCPDDWNPDRVVADQHCGGDPAIYANGTWNGNGFGNYVILEHDRGSSPLYTLYAHLSGGSIKHGVGSTISTADDLGVVARSGYSPQGDHLHFAVGTCAHPWNWKGVDCTIWTAGDTVAGTVTQGAEMPGSYPQIVPVPKTPLCTITGFTPRSATMGIAPITLKTSVQTSGCTVREWRLAGDGGDLFITNNCLPATQECWNVSPDEVVRPDRIPLSLAGDHVHVDANARDQYDRWTYRRFANAFTLNRASAFTSVSVVRKATKVTATGKLNVAMWAPKPRYIGYSLRSVTLERQISPGGAFRVVATAKTKADGSYALAATTGSGAYRVAFAGAAGVAPQRTAVLSR